MVKTIGSSAVLSEIQKLIKQGHQWIKDYTGALELDFSDESKTTHQILDGIETLSVKGTELFQSSIIGCSSLLLILL